MITEEIREELFKLQDIKYRDFQSKLIPGAAQDFMIGVRTPALRKYAKELAGREETEGFLRELPPQIRAWIASQETYTVRFGIGMLMQHFLDEDFDPEYPELVARVRSGEYYVNMMRAWYFATALAKQYEAVVPYIEGYRLDDWTHRKAIQKSVESYRITPEQKEYLKTFKR